MAPVIATQAIQESTVDQLSKYEKKQTNKDLQKTRLCVYNLQGTCGYGWNCTFAHTSGEIRGVPDLKKTQLCTKFMEGSCRDENCTYAHGQEDLRHPPNFKKKFCKWSSKGACRNGASCGFAHHVSELRGVEPPPGFKQRGDPKVAPPRPPPGLEEYGPEDNCGISTEAPSSEETSVEVDAAGAGPTDAPLFHLAGARGAAPLKQQMALMSSAVTALQTKLSQLEGMMMQTQVTQMQQSINELTEQCWSLEAQQCLLLEAGLSAPGMPPVESNKSRLNSKATPFVPFLANYLGSDDSTSVGSDS
jgi:hypothetical protein